ncbi:protein kinase domain-containing protein [Streptomyces sp. 4N509B]|uniref:protein kinase domain-containing protein n=1 Tax=Streptomyces sp. 4N509B TaxID=3457413 RepID=UPI003FD4DF43
MRDQLLGDRYRLVRELGEGGMGQVWEAQDETLGRPVAVKVISQLAGGGSRGDEARARFLREARITAQLQHPNIVTIHDLGETGTDGDRAPFLVMELVRGEGLDAMLRRDAVPLPDVARWGAQICDALADAHDAGVMHRDIKPSNILVTPSGIVKVLDFGIARAADPYATADRLTQTGFIVGTPPYMAPEQARGFPEPRSDLYALGCVLFELITGQLPFQAPDTVGYLSAHLTQDPLTPSSVRAGIPPAWDKLVLTLLHKDPDQRHPSAADLARALRHLGRTSEPGGGPATPATVTLPPPAPTRGASRSPRPDTASTRTRARDGGLPTGTGSAVPERPSLSTATAATALALLCLPALLFMISKTTKYLQDPSAPTGLIAVNMTVGIMEAIVLATGALLLFRRTMAGRWMVVAAGGAAALHCVSASVQYQLVGGPSDVETFAHVIAPLTAVAAVAAVITALHPSTGRWCLRQASVP